MPSTFDLTKLLAEAGIDLQDQEVRGIQMQCLMAQLADLRRQVLNDVLMLNTLKAMELDASSAGKHDEAQTFQARTGSIEKQLEVNSRVLLKIKAQLAAFEKGA